MLVSGAGHWQFDTAAQRFLHDASVRAIIAALGIVTDGRLARHFGNLGLAFDRPPYPTRRYATADRAMHWLRGHLAGDAASQAARSGPG